jgi:diguanylate cyclase (GGDEF)-like protein
MSRIRDAKSLAGAALLFVLLTAASLHFHDRPGFSMAPLGLSLAILLAGRGLGPAGGLAVSGASLVLVVVLWASGRLESGMAAASALCYPSFGLYPWLRRSQRRDQEAEHHKAAEPLRSERDLLEAQQRGLKDDLADLRERAGESDALFRTAREISKLVHLDAMLEFARDAVAETMERRKRPEPAAFLMLMKDDQGRLKPAFASARGARGGGDGMLFESGEGRALAWVASQREARHLPDTAQEASLAGLDLPDMVRSLILLPLVIREELLGSLLVFSAQAKAFDARDLENLKTLANQLVIGMEKTSLYERVQKLSVTDGLTGLYVHRYLLQRLEEEIRRSARYSSSLSLLMLDIDFFKNANDRFGHLAGDEVLKRVAGILKRQVDGLDLVARYGGEEFAVILPDQGQAQALRKAEAIRAAVEAEPFRFQEEDLRVTISGGAASFPDQARTHKGLLELADKALYRSKAEGRNRVSAAS